MKKTLIALAFLFLIGTAAFADGTPNDPCCEELQFSGSYVNAKSGPSTYVFDGQLTFPLFGDESRLLLGPAVHYTSERSMQAAGLVADLNFLGPYSSGPYVSLAALYNIHGFDGADRYTVDAAAGWKQRIRFEEPGNFTGAFVNVFATRTIAGRECDHGFAVNFGIGARF